MLTSPAGLPCAEKQRLFREFQAIANPMLAAYREQVLTGNPRDEAQYNDYLEAAEVALERLRAHMAEHGC